MALVIVMVGLLAWVFWLFIQFGRRLSERGYLGPLTSDALARAEIARQEDGLKEDLRKGVFVIDVRATEFKARFRIPVDAEPPLLTPGVEIDEAGRILYRSIGSGSGGGFDELGTLSAEILRENIKGNPGIKAEIDRRFEEGYREAQLDAYRQARYVLKQKSALQHCSPV